MSNEIVIKNNSFIQSMHNDIQCLSLDDAARPCDRCWFTSKQIQDWAGMNKATLNRKLEKLVRVGRIIGLQDTTNNIIDIDNNVLANDTIDTKSTKASKIGSSSNLSQTLNTDIQLAFIEDSYGVPHEMKIYNLNVLNHLAMVELDNEKLNSIANKFSDILSEVETTGSYGLQIDKHDLLLLNAIKAKSDTERVIAISELEQFHEDEKRALKADNENLTQVLTDTSEKLIAAIKTKAQINDKRTASLMGKVSGQSRKITKLENDLTAANDNINELTTQVNDLQTELDDTYSSLYRDKRVAEIVKGKYEFITYKFNTLKQRVNKALKAIALALGESIKEKPNPMNDTYAPMLYFTKRTVDQLLDNIEQDHNYLKRFSK